MILLRVILHVQEILIIFIGLISISFLDSDSERDPSLDSAFPSVFASMRPENKKNSPFKVAFLN